MVANVSSLTAAQNKPSVQQAGPAAAPAGAQSFATMLNNEIHSSAPARPSTPPAAASTHKVAAINKVTAANKEAAATPTPEAAGNKVATSASGNAKSATSTATASGNAQGNKRSDKSVPQDSTAQTDTAAAAATAATAATLAAAASGAAAAAANNQATTANVSAATDSQSASAVQVAASAASGAGTPVDQSAASSDTTQAGMNNLVANFTGNTPAAVAHDPNVKTVMNSSTNGAVPLASPAAGKAPAAPLVSQTAVAANPSQMSATPGKNSAEQSGGQNQFSSGANAPSVSGKAAAEVPPVSVSPASNQSAGASLASALNGAAQNSATPAVTVKAANQDLSIQQLNALAPVLTTPINLESAASTSTIAPQVGSQGWDQAVGQKINWMVSGGQSSASLTLNPPELGPMQIVLNVNNQHASATFISHQPEVRAALENAIPKLREMMEQSGIQLGQCDVSSQARQQDFAQNQSGSGNGRASAAASSNVSVMPLNTASLPRSGTGLVDTFV